MTKTNKKIPERTHTIGDDEHIKTMGRDELEKEITLLRRTNDRLSEELRRTVIFAQHHVDNFPGSDELCPHGLEIPDHCAICLTKRTNERKKEDDGYRNTK
jgi:uncharacterized small protein (DUF1192 family)